MILVTTFSSLLPQEKVKCLEDNVFKWTSTANTFFATNVFIKKTVMIILGILVDLVVLAQFYFWCILGKSWRYPIAISCVYALRMLLSSIYYMAYPDNYLWEFPGFFSLTV